jgi:DNA-binding transcriptional regulator YiaG
MTKEKALLEWQRMLRETRSSEELCISDQRDMGDACKDLRIACGVSRETVAKRLNMSVGMVKVREGLCSTGEAERFKAAVLGYDPDGHGIA